MKLLLPPGSRVSIPEETAKWLGTSRVTIALAEHYDEIVSIISEGSFDVIWTPPFVCALSSDRHGKTFVVERVAAARFGCAILARSAEVGPKATIEMLDGKRAAWVHKMSTAGFLVAKREIDKAGVRIAGEEFFGSFPAAVKAVQSGEADFCSVYHHPSSSLLRTSPRTSFPPAELEGLSIVHAVSNLPADAIVITKPALQRAPRLGELADRAIPASVAEMLGSATGLVEVDPKRVYASLTKYMNTFLFR